MSAAGQEDRLNALLRVCRVWRLELNINDLLSRIANDVVNLLDLDNAIVFLIENNVLNERARCSKQPESLTIADKPHSLAVRAVQDGRPIHGRSTGIIEADVICVPLTANRGVLGAIYIHSATKNKAFTRADHEFVDMLALQAAAAIEHSILYYSAITDPLTGLYTHRHFQQEVEQAVRRSDRNEQPVTLVLLDLDHFKALNDTAGHDAGNKCIVKVADILRNSLRATDVIARFGGDEFELLLPDTPIEAAVRVVETIRCKIADLEFPGNCRITGTLGLACFPANAIDGQSLFNETDAALYQAKEAGRNRAICSGTKAPAKLRRDLQSSKGMMDSTGVLVQPDTRISTDGGLPSKHIAGEKSEKIDGHEVIRRLGSGSAGEVLLVRQPELDREIALKRPLTANLKANQVRVFENEAKLTASLEHPGVVPVHSMGRDIDGRRYYTMRPLKGRTLAEVLESQKKGNVQAAREFSERRMLEIIQRVAETVAYAHRRETTHLDITPSNIILGEFGEVTLIDWGRGSYSLDNAGFSRLSGESIDDQRSDSFLFGSPGYIAPEQLPDSKSPTGPPSDVYAIAAILYEILSGKSPQLEDTMQQTVATIRCGKLVAIECAASDRGLDPMLCELCMSALALEPAARPTAKEFADRLGRYVRREAEWRTIQFKGTTSDEWHALAGKWRFEDGVHISAGSDDNILLLKTATPGAFRFVCEAWHELGGELSVIGRGPAIDANFGRDYRSRYSGYCFEFGAESNICTKLARNGVDVRALPGCVVKPNQRYRLEIEFIDGWLHCYIDGKRIFEYRELFQLPGRQIGFYAFGKGAHFRAIEVHYEGGGLQISAMQVADELFQAKQYEKAAERYRDLAQEYPKRLEGVESRLKHANCLAALHRYTEARSIYESLKGTPLEPFALAEHARVNLDDHEQSPESAISYLQALVSRYPIHALAPLQELALTRRRHLSAGVKDIRHAIPLVNDLATRESILRLARDACNPPLHSQIMCARNAATLQVQLGKYHAALSEALAFLQKLSPEQRDAPYVRLECMPYLQALAVGRDDLLPSRSLHDFIGLRLVGNWCTGLALHFVVRRGNAESFLRALSPVSDVRNRPAVGQNIMLINLAMKQVPAAIAEARRSIIPNIRSNTLGGLAMVSFGGAAVESHDETMYQVWSEFVSDNAASIRGVNAEWVCNYLHGRWAIEHGNFDEAASHLRQMPDLTEVILGNPLLFASPILLNIFLHSLGVLSTHTDEELFHILNLVAPRPELDLGLIMLGRQAPGINSYWPHPLWRPELRYWLALWLHAKGQNKAAREIILPSRDSRYGLTHCQPGIVALIDDIEKKVSVG